MTLVLKALGHSISRVSRGRPFHLQWVLKKKLVAKALDGDLGVIDETRDSESRCELRSRDCPVKNVI